MKSKSWVPLGAWLLVLGILLWALKSRACDFGFVSDWATSIVVNNGLGSGFQVSQGPLQVVFHNHNSENATSSIIHGAPIRNRESCNNHVEGSKAIIVNGTPLPHCFDAATTHTVCDDNITSAKSAGNIFSLHLTMSRSGTASTQEATTTAQSFLGTCEMPTKTGLFGTKTNIGVAIVGNALAPVGSASVVLSVPQPSSTTAPILPAMQTNFHCPKDGRPNSNNPTHTYCSEQQHLLRFLNHYRARYALERYYWHAHHYGPPMP